MQFSTCFTIPCVGSAQQNVLCKLYMFALPASWARQVLTYVGHSGICCVTISCKDNFSENGCLGCHCMVAGAMTEQLKSELTDGLQSNVRKTKRQGHSSSKRPYLLRHIELTFSCVLCHPRLLSLPNESLTMLCSYKANLHVNKRYWTIGRYSFVLCDCTAWLAHVLHCKAIIVAEEPCFTAALLL